MVAFFVRIFEAFSNVFGRFVSGIDEDEAIVLIVFCILFIGCFFSSVICGLRGGDDGKA